MMPIHKRTLPPSFNGSVESGGMVSIEPADFTTSETKNGVSYIEIPYYGRTRSGIKSWPVRASSQDPSRGSKLTYDFYAFSERSSAKLTIVFGATLNLHPMRPLKFAYSLDSSDAVSK